MDWQIALELFGYLGSLMVVVSMLMSSLVKLRIINSIGSVISGTYAFIIGSFPLALMNICLLAINLYNLRGLFVNKQQYDLVRFSYNDTFIGYFLNHYKEDIGVYFPDFREATAQMDAVYMIFCNGDPAGIFLGRYTGQGTVDVALEYTTPAYRDCSIGKFLYSALPDDGVDALVVRAVSQKHQPYMHKMGYRLEDRQYIKDLK